MAGQYSSRGPQQKNKTGGHLRKHRFVEDTPIHTVSRQKLLEYKSLPDKKKRRGE